MPYDEPDSNHDRRASFSEPSSGTPSLSRDADEQMMHYVGQRKQPKNPVKRVLWKNFTPKGLMGKMLRKTIKRNTWIYVAVGRCGRRTAAEDADVS